MKKYLLSALALPLLFACSSEDFSEQKVTSNDQFAGIAKVDATFSMDEGATMRMDKGSWDPQEGDLWGFAWMGDGTVIANNPADGKAYQNHNLIQTSGIFTPQTSIYVGKYYIYRPYDETTVTPQPINFNSLAEQTITEGFASSTQAWKDLAKTAINIGDKWTDVTPGGTPDAEDPEFFWNKAGIKEHYQLYAAMFSNQTGLDLKYEKNNPTFAADKEISGATDIKHTFKKGTAVGAADIYSGTVELAGAAKSFTYAPTVEPNNGVYPQTVGGKVVYHNGDFWADKTNLAAVVANTPGDGFTFTDGAITLNSPDADKDGVLDGISTGNNESTAWFWFNSLPVTAGNGDEATVVTPVFETSYGQVTVLKAYPATKYTVKDCAYALNVEDGNAVWYQLQNADDDIANKKWKITGHNTFINQYGNHKGKFKLTVDFSKGVMNNMHIKNDAHLQKLLKYYLASGKTEEDVVLNLDGDANKEFKISKISIALLQTIGGKVKVQACGTHNNPVKIIVTQDDQATFGLADKKEVPALNNVFAVATDVYLSKDCEWTWTEGAAAEGKIPAGILTIDNKVKSITNEGTLTVNATNVQLSEADVKIFNAKDATMNITKVTTVKNTLHNYGTLNVGSKSNTTAELRAYGPKWIVNNATSLTEHGVINNFGVVGVTAGTSGQFNNYGLINMMNNEAITLLTSNERGTDPFKNTFDSSTNKMGTVVLPDANPYAIVSVSNGAETGFIKYNWTEATYTHDPGNVKYNTLVVSGNIEFTGDPATEIQFIEFDGTNRALVVNPAAADKLTNLQGIIVKDNSSIIIEKTNKINCADGAFLGAGATVYKGGAFTVAGAAFATPTNTTMYLGTWSLDQIVEY